MKNIKSLSRLMLLPLIAFFAVLNLSACKVESAEDNGPKQSHTVEGTDFNKISIAYPADVTYIPSDTYGVEVTTTATQFAKLDIQVKNGELQIKRLKDKKTKGIVITRDADVKITVRAPQLTKVSIAGSGDFECKSTMKAEKLSLNIAGSGEIDIHNIEASAVSAEIAGSGEIDIRNIEASAVSAEIAGSGDIEAGLTGVENTKISIAGSGGVEMRMHHCGSVKATIAGSGDIELEGDIQSLSQSVAGSGTVNVKKLSVKNN